MTVSVYEIIVGFFIGIAIGYLIAKLKFNNELNNEKAQHQLTKKELEMLNNLLEEQKKFVSESKDKLREAFDSLAYEALSKNNQSFLDLAKTKLENYVNESKIDIEERRKAIDLLVKPLNENLTEFGKKIQDLETKRASAYSNITTVIENANNIAVNLQKETITLSSALKNTQIRGRYGEIQLKNMIELTGMVENVDFFEQESTQIENGRNENGENENVGNKKQRPDLIIRLPQDRILIVDVKTPLESYMKAFDNTEENKRAELFKKHAEAVKRHVDNLSGKKYWEQYENAADFVIMYLPIESSFMTALEYDKNLIQYAMERKVFFATPTTFITLLRTIEHGWQQIKLAADIEEIKNTGIEIYNNVIEFMTKISEVGAALNKAKLSYNGAIDIVEKMTENVKTLKEKGGTFMDKKIPTIKTIPGDIKK